MRWIRIEEFPVPGIFDAPPPEEWDEMELKILHGTTRRVQRIVNTGQMLYEMTISPMRDRPAANEAQRVTIQDIIKKLDPKPRQGKCQVAVGKFVGLEKDEYEWVMGQAKVWQFVPQAPEYFEMVASWADAPEGTKPPKEWAKHVETSPEPEMEQDDAEPGGVDPEEPATNGHAPAVDAPRRRRA